jgi:precorrin-2/cobalt-factor-2 C20-methyltransferase
VSHLFLVGVGPGDPELLTRKAERILKEVDVIAAPVTAPGEQSQALGIVREFLDEHRQHLLPLLFPMTADRTLLKSHWDEACRLVAHQIGLGKKVAFITLGDPLFYATSLYMLDGMRRDYPDVPVEVIPGVSSLFAAAAKAVFPLAEGAERLMVLPATAGMDQIYSAMEQAETLVLLKVKPVFDQIVGFLKTRTDLSVLFAERVGMAGELILTSMDEIAIHRPDYLSLIVIRKCSC